MFDFQPMELVILGAVAIVVVPPKDLPKAMRAAGYWVGRLRGVTQQFRSGFDTIVREAELQEMEAKWAAENQRIMREHQATPELEAPAELPAPLASEQDYDGSQPSIDFEHSAAVADGAPEHVNQDRASL